MIILIILTYYQAYGQQAKFEALYLYNFCRFIEWPAGYGTNEFVIGVVGNNKEIIKHLNTYAASKTIQNKSVSVRKISGPQEAGSCHILFFAKGSEDQISFYLSTGKKTVFMSEADGALVKGSDINFFMKDNKLRFSYSKTNVDKKEVKVSADLYQLASKVQ